VGWTYIYISAKGWQKCLNVTILGTSSRKRGWRSIGRAERWKIRGKVAREMAFYSCGQEVVLVEPQLKSEALCLKRKPLFPNAATLILYLLL